jgi:DNA-binding Lrp family transcriptional regulator
MDEIDKKLLTLIQLELPIDKRPFQIIADNLSITEKEVLERIDNLKKEGLLRRIGGIFNSRKLGYTSTLCAAKVPLSKVDYVAKVINSYDEITHNYIREGIYNMWFTVITYSQDTLFSIIDEIKINTDLDNIISLPAIKLFKIKVALDLGGDEDAKSS